MKKPLNYQVTEYDCGKVTLENAFSFLFEREEIPSEVIKLISNYTLDCYDKDGNIGQGGTSREALRFLATKLEEYRKIKNFPVFSKHLKKEEVTFDIINTTLKYNGCIVYRTHLEEEHYVLLTRIDQDYIYMWDPYYLETYFDQVEIIYDQPFLYNRKVPLYLFNQNNNNNYTIGESNFRECLILARI